MFVLVAVVGEAGTSGIVGNFAPLPGEDANELPMAFVASTVV